MTYDGTHSYRYDAENRLTAVDGGSTASYAYDPIGRRVAKTMGGTTTSYVYDQAGNVVFDTQASSWVTTYLYFAGRLQAQYKNGVTSFIHGDHLGSTRFVTDMYQYVSDNLDYLPFGEQIAGDTSTTHKFTGYPRDEETEPSPANGTANDFALARYYGSRMGRFLSPDPLGMGAADLTNPQSLNQYAYVGNNPTNVTDPNGTDWGDGGGFGGFGGGGCDWCEQMPGAGGFGGPPILIGGPGLNLPPPPGIGSSDPSACTYGSGSCGGMIYGFHTDQGGLTVGDFPGETICIGHPGEGCMSEFWTGLEWEVGVPISSNAAQILGSAGRMADQELKRDVVQMAVGDALGAAGGVIADAARGPWESALFGRNGGFLNSNQWLRAGYGWSEGQASNVFRITGRLVNGRHFINWPW